MPNVITSKPKKRCLSSSSVCGGDTCWFGEFGVIGLIVLLYYVNSNNIMYNNMQSGMLQKLENNLF